MHSLLCQAIDNIVSEVQNKGVINEASIMKR